MKKILTVTVVLFCLTTFYSISANAGTKGRLNTLIILESIGLADRAGIIDLRGITRSVLPYRQSYYYQYPSSYYQHYQYPAQYPQVIYPSDSVVLYTVDCNDRNRYPTAEEREACKKGEAERLARLKKERIQRAYQEGRTGYYRY